MLIAILLISKSCQLYVNCPKYFTFSLLYFVNGSTAFWFKTECNGNLAKPKFTIWVPPFEIYSYTNGPHFSLRRLLSDQTGNFPNQICKFAPQYAKFCVQEYVSVWSCGKKFSPNWIWNTMVAVDQPLYKCDHFSQSGRIFNLNFHFFEYFHFFDYSIFH